MAAEINAQLPQLENLCERMYNAQVQITNLCNLIKPLQPAPIFQQADLSELQPRTRAVDPCIACLSASHQSVDAICIRMGSDQRWRHCVPT